MSNSTLWAGTSTASSVLRPVPVAGHKFGTQH
jgi:hypothetical protein